MPNLFIRILPLLLIVNLLACSQDEGSNSNKGIISSSLEDMARESLPGAKLAKRRCGSCHYLDRNIRKVGPTLKGIIGRAPSISGVPFKTWDERSMDAWLKDPAGIKPGTLMAIPGIKSDKDRADIIEYLKQFSP